MFKIKLQKRESIVRLDYPNPDDRFVLHGREQVVINYNLVSRVIRTKMINDGTYNSITVMNYVKFKQDGTLKEIKFSADV